MKVLILAGFLGSGKTTLLLQIVKALSLTSPRMAVIENELGDFGVDGDYLELEGLQVKQLLGGCICCTLSMGLVETLDSLNRNYQPDIVILEATGAADPGDVAANLKSWGFGIDSVKVITLVDAKRFSMLMEMMTPLLTSQIQSADIVVVNKTDLVDRESVERILGEIGRMNTHGHTHTVSLERGGNLNLIMDQLEC
jgi:G3E family GTPase